MHRSPTRMHRITVLATAAVVFAACGGSDDDPSDASDSTSGEATTSPTTAAPATTAPATTAPPTTAPATTAPATTAPPTTAPATVPETTAPATSEPSAVTTEPDTSIPGDVDLALAQFCFDSEQVYVFNQVTSVLTDPTPEQAEASLSILDFTIDAAVESAPVGMGTQPQRAAELLDEMLVVFEQFDYDVAAMAVAPELDDLNEVFVEFDGVMSELAGFVDDECTPASAVLDSQAIKLAPVVEQLLDWPLQPIANQAGDIRMFVPTEWSEWIGSTDVESVTVLEASSDIEQFENTWNVAGVLATVAYVGDDNAVPTELLDSSSAGPDCTLDSTEPYTDDVYVGELHLLSDCAGVGTDAAVLAVTDQAASSVEVTLEFQFPGGYERELLDQMLAGFAAGA